MNFSTSDIAFVRCIVKKSRSPHYTSTAMTSFPPSPPMKGRTLRSMLSSSHQHEVHRLLGRCTLRLQQYELLMKALLAHYELAGPIETLQEQQAVRVNRYGVNTLGNLVRELFEGFAVAEGHEHDLLPVDRTPTDRMSFGFNCRIEMSPDQLAQTRAALEQLVAMRNELVHHFIERFDLSNDDGCHIALQHLEDCYGRIDRHHGDLLQWASRVDEARAEVASFVQSQAFRNLLVDGIAPDGTVEWHASGIVRGLRSAVERFSESGWTRLDRARSWLAESHPEQTPARYGCRSRP